MSPLLTPENKANFIGSPNYTANWKSCTATKAYTINRSDARNDAIYVPVGLANYWNQFWVMVHQIPIP